MIEGAKIGARTISAATAALLAGMLLAGGVQAGDAGSIARHAAFAALSPGNQIIARALYRAQRAAPEGAGPATPWGLDRIATGGGSEGWEAVFQRMKTDGLISSESLGQVVNTYQATRPVAQFTPSHDGFFVIAGGADQSSAITDPARARSHPAGAVVATATGRSDDADRRSASDESRISNDNGTADPSFIDGSAVATGAPSAGPGGDIGSGHGHGRSR